MRDMNGNERMPIEVKSAGLYGVFLIPAGNWCMTIASIQNEVTQSALIVRDLMLAGF